MQSDYALFPIWLCLFFTMIASIMNWHATRDVVAGIDRLTEVQRQRQ